MCNPAFIPYAIAAVGAIAGGVAQKQAADYESKVARNNAEIATRKAYDAEDRGQYQRDQLRLETARALARGRLAYAAGGIDLGSGGSVDNWQLDVAKSLEIDEQNSIYNAGQEKQGFLDQRYNFLSQASAAKASGRNAMTAAVISAAGSMAGGYAAGKAPSTTGGGPSLLSRQGTTAGGNSVFETRNYGSMNTRVIS